MHQDNFNKFQQDGTPPHYNICVSEFLDNAFRRKVIGRCRSIDMPPRSPDITPMDFYFCGVVRNRACTTKQKMIGNEKLVTEDAFGKTGKDVQLCKEICSSDPKCLQQCKNSEGSQFEHLRYTLIYKLE